MAIESRRVLRGYVPLHEAMNLLVESSIIAHEGVGRYGAFPPVDVFVTDDDVLVEMGMPGGNPDNLSISVTGETLVISGEVMRQPSSERGHRYLREIWQGTFQRSLTLPAQVDSSKADASCVDGILTLRLPKAEAAKRHTIHVERQPQPIARGHVQTAEDDVASETIATPPTKVLVS